MDLLGDDGSTPNPLNAANLAAVSMDLGMGGVYSSETKAKKRGSVVTNSAVHLTTPNPIARSNSAATAATLLNMSNDRRISATLGPSSMTTAAGGVYPSQHGLTMTTADASNLGDALTTAAPSSYRYGYAATASARGDSLVSGRISIVAPTHEDLLQAGKHPEPSPAACGKRKLDEITAAQMLAGVVGATNPRSMTSNTATATDSVEAIGKDRSSTPPPPQTLNDSYLNTPGAGGAATGTAASSQVIPGSTTGHGVALQILNPDIFGDQGNATGKRRLTNGSASPLTPWDGQLAALVRLVTHLIIVFIIFSVHAGTNEPSQLPQSSQVS